MWDTVPSSEQPASIAIDDLRAEMVEEQTTHDKQTGEMMEEIKSLRNSLETRDRHLASATREITQASIEEDFPRNVLMER